MEQETKQCQECNGSGKNTENKKCRNCNGKGKVPDWSKDNKPEEMICWNCKKKFWIPNRKCRIRDIKDGYPTCDSCRNRGVKYSGE